MATVSMTDPPRLQELPDSMPDDGAINMKLVDGAPVFRASLLVQERVQELLDKQELDGLSPEEGVELDRYEAVDDYLSYLNRLVRNLLTQ